MCLPWPFRRREGYDLLCWGPLLSGSSPYSVTFSTKSGRTPLLPFQALLLFRLPSELTLRTLFALPAFGVTDHTEQVPVDDFVGSLPVPRAEDLVQNPHIDPRVLVKQQDRADLAGLRSADALDPTFDVLFRQKGDFLLDGRRGHGGRRRVLGGFGGRGGRLRHLSGRLFLFHVIRPLYLI